MRSHFNNSHYYDFVKVKTTLTAQEPTVDSTITLPNITGTVITTGNLTVDETPTGDVLVGEGDSLAFSIVFGS